MLSDQSNHKWLSIFFLSADVASFPVVSFASKAMRAQSKLRQNNDTQDGHSWGNSVTPMTKAYWSGKNVSLIYGANFMRIFRLYCHFCAFIVGFTGTLHSNWLKLSHFCDENAKFAIKVPGVSTIF